MKLYVCYGTFGSPRPGGHPCGNAYRALKDAGHDPEVVRTYGLGLLPDVINSPGRRRIKKQTGSSWMPALETDDGELIQDSQKIVEWAQKHPAATATT
jgi:hypothetical protein